MKNKKTTYFLIVAVAGVWGLIFLKIFSKEDVSAKPFQKTTSFGEFESLERYEMQDTFNLSLNYRDPFTGKVPETGLYSIGDTSAKGSIQLHYPLPEHAPIDWSFIKYNGCIINPRTNQVVSIITVNGKEKMIRKGEVFDGVKLLTVHQDSIKISYQGKIKHITQS